MKKLAVLVVVILTTSFSAISCSEESAASTDALYEVEATEGDHGHVEQDPDED